MRWHLLPKVPGHNICMLLIAVTRLCAALYACHAGGRRNMAQTHDRSIGFVLAHLPDAAGPLQSLSLSPQKSIHRRDEHPPLHQ